MRLRCADESNSFCYSKKKKNRIAILQICIVCIVYTRAITAGTLDETVLLCTRPKERCGEMRLRLRRVCFFPQVHNLSWGSGTRRVQ